MSRLKTMRVGARGFSMLEALISAAVLVVGLTGIVLMLIRGATNARNGQQAHESSQIMTQVIADFEAGGFDNLVLTAVGASFDGGTAVDAGIYFDASQRPYLATAIITNMGFSNPTYSVDVEVAYRDGTGQIVYKRGGTIMSRAPDAGP